MEEISFLYWFLKSLPESQLRTLLASTAFVPVLGIEYQVAISFNSLSLSVLNLVQLYSPSSFLDTSWTTIVVLSCVELNSRLGKLFVLSLLGTLEITTFTLSFLSVLFFLRTLNTQSPLFAAITPSLQL